MSRLPLHHAEATKRANIMFGATLLAAAGCLAILLLPRRAVELPEPTADTSMSLAQPKERAHPTEGISVNWSRVGAIGERLNAPPVREWKKEQERLLAEASSSAPGSVAGAEEEPTRGGGFAPPWRYIGAVIDGERRTALVAIPEPNAPARQRFIAEGFTKDDYRLISILPDKIVVEQGKTRHEIPIAESTRGTGITVGSSIPPVRFAPTQTGGIQPDRSRPPGTIPGRGAPTMPGGQPPLASPNPVPASEPPEGR